MFHWILDADEKPIERVNRPRYENLEKFLGKDWWLS